MSSDVTMVKRVVSSVSDDVSDVKQELADVKQFMVRQTARDKAHDSLTAAVRDHEIDLDVDPEPFACGGQARIHKAMFHGEVVVLKRVLLVDGLTHDHRERIVKALRNEIAIMTKIRSPLIVQIMGVVTVDPTYFGLVLEYVPGGTLRDRLANVANSIDDATKRRWCRQIAMGMQYLYGQQVQHRDLKPSNILLDDMDKCKIADFGLAKSDELLTQSSHGTHGTGRAAGTLAYMAPELLERHDFSEKCDVYSYGCCCYEVAARLSPWKGLNEGQIIRAVCYEKERPSLPTDAPSDLVDLTTACWHQDPDERPTFADIARPLPVTD